MKTVLYLFITCFIFCGAMLSASVENPYPNFAVAFGVLALFIWGCDRRARKAAQKRYREQLFEQQLWMMRNKR